MPTGYAFAFDASACTGCKACQVACKDKHQLPAGVLWRRVYEVSGGDWEKSGAAWTNTVFAYNVSVGCNHCAHPACAAACPTRAYTVRDDGIVYQEEEKCIGCQYCLWACPYGAPQYSQDLGRVTKCDLCRDLIDEGQPPACVAACPMRALEIIEPQALELVETQSGAKGQKRAEVRRLPFPLTRTQADPSILIKPHPAMFNELRKVVSNYEEVRRLKSRGAEWPLVAFTLLAQAAAGVAVMAYFTGAMGDMGAMGAMTRPVLMLIGLLVAFATLSSLLHLRDARDAWRSTANFRTSALSREIVALGIFGGTWLFAWAMPGMGRAALALAGVGLVESMVRVYDLEAILGWSRRRTRATFGAAALLLGALIFFLLTSVIRATALWAASIGLVTIAVVAVQITLRRRFYMKTSDKLM